MRHGWRLSIRDYFPQGSATSVSYKRDETIVWTTQNERRVIEIYLTNIGDSSEPKRYWHFTRSGGRL